MKIKRQPRRLGTASGGGKELEFCVSKEMLTLATVLYMRKGKTRKIINC